MELKRANALILSHVFKQAIVQATDDTFLFAFAVMTLCIIPIMFLRTKRKPQAEKVVSIE